MNMKKSIIRGLRGLKDTLAATQTSGAALVAIVMGLLLASGNASADIAVTGYGHYCSMTWPNGGWAFTSDTNGKDPCGSIIAKSDPGGTIQRAGIYHASSWNTAVALCSSDNTVWLYKGIGNGPMTAAYNKAQGRKGCIFTVAPQDLPVFNGPFKGTTPRVSNGFDFAKPPIII